MFGIPGGRSGRKRRPATLLVDDGDGVLSTEFGNPPLLLFTSVASAVNYLTLTNSATGGKPILAAQGSDSNVPLQIQCKGAPTVGVVFDLGTSNVLSGVQFQSTHTTGAGGTYFFSYTNNTGTIAADDLVGGFSISGNDDTHTQQPYFGFDVFIADPTAGVAKGKVGFDVYGDYEFCIGGATGGVAIGDNIFGTGPAFPGNGNLSFADAKGIYDANANESLIFQTTASAVNYIEITNSATGTGPLLAAAGSDTDVNLRLAPQGAGKIVATKAFVETVVTLTDGATPALNAASGNIFVLTAAGDRTIAVPSNATSGQKIIIRHEASGGARTLALNTGAGGFRYGTDITGLTATTSGKSDYIGCVYDGTDSFWDVVSYVKGF